MGIGSIKCKFGTHDINYEVSQVQIRVLLSLQLGFADLTPLQSSWKYNLKM